LASAPPTIEPSDISPISIVEEMKTSYYPRAAYARIRVATTAIRIHTRRA
jgi:hypothetical protein